MALLRASPSPWVWGDDLGAGLLSELELPLSCDKQGKQAGLSRLDLQPVLEL